MEYYIKDSEKPDGPYDMMAIIRKMRNGTVAEDTPIATSIFEEAKPAATYDEFKDFFLETNEDIPSIHSFGSAPRGPRGLGDMLGRGADFLKQNHYSAVYSGVFMILWLLVAAMFMFSHSVILSVAGVALCYFLVGGYTYGIARYVRGNPVDVGLIIQRMAGSAVNMLVVSLMVAVLMLPGILLTIKGGVDLLFISLPVLFIFLFVVMTFLAFAPLLVVDKQQDFWDAMQGSVRFVMKDKAQYLGVVFALIALNFLLLPLMPVILPITMGALAELYDEQFG